ncbi:MAG: BppU family phage baseplate upper protein [Firmicutes bacterium]|nr:BppU family phage baseplate upper protein [Bacillota bacterium]
MITREIKVWIGAAKGIIPPVKVSQYDTEWQFVFTVYKDDVVWDMAGVSTVSLNGVKEDGTAFVYPGSISSGHVVVDCGEQMTSAAGRVECELRFFTNYGKLVSTANFRLLVEQAPMTGYRASGSEFDEMNQLVNAALEGTPAWVAEHLTDEAAAQSALEAAASATAAAASATAAANALPTVKAEMALFGADDLLWPFTLTVPSSAAHGLTWAKDDATYTLTVSGTTTGTPSFARLYYNQNALPAWAEAGKTYRVRINNDKVQFEVYEYPGETARIKTKTGGTFKLSANATGLMIRVVVYGTGVAVDETLQPYISVAPSLPELEAAIPAQIDDAKTVLKAEMAQFGVEDLLWNNHTPQSDTDKGLTYTVHPDERTVTVTGTSTGANSLFDFYRSSTVLPSWVVPEKTYRARVNGDKVRLWIYEYREGGTLKNIFASRTSGTFKFTDAAVGAIIRLVVPTSGTAFGDGETVSPSISIAPTLEELDTGVTPKPTARIMFFGDSITRGVNGGYTSSADRLAKRPIPEGVAEELGIVCENFGIGDIGWVSTGSAGTYKGNALEYLQRVGDPDYYATSASDSGATYNGSKFRGSGDWSDFNALIIWLGANDASFKLYPEGYTDSEANFSTLMSGYDALTYDEVMAWDTGREGSSEDRIIVKAVYQVFRYVRESEAEHGDGEPYVTGGSAMPIILVDPLLSGGAGSAPWWTYKATRSGGYTKQQMYKMYADFAQRYGLGHIATLDAPLDRMHLLNSLPDTVHPNTLTYEYLARFFAGKIGGLLF